MMLNAKTQLKPELLHLLEGIYLGNITYTELAAYLSKVLNESVDESYVINLIKEIQKIDNSILILKDINVNGRTIKLVLINLKYIGKLVSKYGMRDLRKLVNYKKEIENYTHDQIKKEIGEYFKSLGYKVTYEYPIEYKNYRGMSSKGKIDIVVESKGGFVLGIEIELGGNPTLQVINNLNKVVKHFKKPVVFLAPKSLLGYYKHIFAVYFYTILPEEDLKASPPVLLMNLFDYKALSQFPPSAPYLLFPLNYANTELPNPQDNEKSEAENSEAKEIVEAIEEAKNSENKVNNETNGCVVLPATIEMHYSDIMHKLNEIDGKLVSNKEADALIHSQIISKLDALYKIQDETLEINQTQNKLIFKLSQTINNIDSTLHNISDKITETNKLLETNTDDKYFKFLLGILSVLVISYIIIVVAFFFLT